MFFAILCVYLSPFFEISGKPFIPGKAKRTIKSSDEGFYYIHLLNRDIKRNLSQEPNFKGKMVRTWFSSFLDCETAQKLRGMKDIELFDIPSSMKKPSQLKGELRFIVNSHENFLSKIDRSLFSEAKLYAGDDEFFVKVNSKENLSKAVDYLSHSKDVLFFYELPIVKPLNRFARGFIQNGDNSVAFNGQTYVSKASLYDLGYTGSGEIVTICDSGLDYSLRFFRDQNIPLIYDVYNAEHRKIVFYSRSAATQYDGNDASGHGTHCAGSIAGEDITSSGLTSAYNGAAPKAKLYVLDLEDPNGNMYADPDLSTTTRNMTNFGSYLSSNSWGVDSRNSFLHLSYDTLSYRFPDILWVFAAGNEHGIATVMDPAASKNLLCVGALDVIPNFQLNDESRTTYKIVDEDGATISFSTLEFSGSIYSYTLSGSNNYDFSNKNVIDYSSSSAISDLTNYAVIVDSCDQATQASSKNCKLIISGTTISCPAVNAVGVRIENSNLLTGKTISLIPIGTSELPISIASFSSKGPSIRGPLKPEVVAPGSAIYSSNRGDDTSVIQKSGTSMACPSVVGSLVLLRQYLRDKLGIASPPNYLMRALVICGATKPNQPEKPDNQWGFGYVNLANLVQENSGNILKIQNQIELNIGRTIAYTLDVQNNDRDLSIALGYNDIVTSADSAVYLGVNADLFVVSPSNKLYHPLGNSEDFYSTLERIYISKQNVEVGSYKIYIRTYGDLPSNFVYGALVAIGSIGDILPATTSGSVYDGLCQNGGVASQNRCTCSENFRGLFCQHQIYTISVAQPRNFTIESMEPLYLKVNISGIKEKLNINMKQFGTNHFSFVHVTIDGLPEEPSDFSMMNYANKTQESLIYSTSTGDMLSIIYILISNQGNSKMDLNLSITLDTDPEYTDDDDGGGSLNGAIIYIVVVVVIIIVAIVAIFLICRFWCKRGASAEEQSNGNVRRRGDASSSSASSYESYPPNFQQYPPQNPKYPPSNYPSSQYPNANQSYAYAPNQNPSNYQSPYKY